jgi:adenosylcobalamin-dependent ribonucleoside-triphosphate reductase
MIAPGTKPVHFYLSEKFKKDLKAATEQWGFGGLSAFTFYRTYSRKKANGTMETWADCVIRVIEGMFTILKTHAKLSHIPWNDKKAAKHAEEAATRMFEFKWLPPGRGLWMMGTPFVWEKGGACLNNCAFVSTENIETELSKPFAFLMDMSMVGVGVGFDTKGADRLPVNMPSGKTVETVVVDDSREGWVEAISCLIDSYLEPDSNPVEINTSLVRPYGDPIAGFGGVASGPEPLEQGFYGIRDVLEKRAMSDDNLLSSTDIVDIMNLIGKIVVAGNVRRTAEIAFAEPDDQDFIEMKRWDKFGVETGSIAPPELKAISEEEYERYNNDWNARGEIAKKYANYEWSYKFGGWRWASNNSLFAYVGMDYTDAAKSIAVNGEPGFAWLDNMQKYGRMKDGVNNKDYRVRGGNPCLEQSLEPYELCCLVENFPAKHKDYWDFQRTLKFSYMYAKTVTLMATHWSETNAVITRNRRIGCSQSGIQTAMLKFGRHKYFDQFCDRAYTYIQYVDQKYAEWLGVPKSIKTTSVKPSGTVSLVAGELPGIHYAESENYYSTVRVAANSPFVPLLQEAGYRIEPAVSDPTRTVVVYFPVLLREGTISNKNISIWEQFANAVDMQHYWADNQVSITITFNQSEADQIARALSAFDNRLKGVSLLPVSDHGYAQAPYTTAPKDELEKYAATLKPINFDSLTKEGDNADANKFCDGDSCVI